MTKTNPHNQLLAMLFQFDEWGHCSDSIAAAYEDLLCSLCSSHAGFLEPVFDLLLKNLKNMDDYDESVYQKKVKSLHKAIKVSLGWICVIDNVF